MMCRKSVETGLALSFLSVLVAGCASDGPPKPERKCPQVAILRPLEKIEDHGNDMIDPSTLVAAARMLKVDGNCTYDEKGADVRLTLTMGAEKASRLGGDKMNFPFFISLVDAQDKVVSKEIMTANFVFEEDKKVSVVEMPLRVFIPLKEDESAEAFRVLTGFQLTEEQLKTTK